MPKIPVYCFAEEMYPKFLKRSTLMQDMKIVGNKLMKKLMLQFYPGV